MPCTSPLQGFFVGPNGQFKFSREAQEAFKAGKPLEGQGAVPCGQCLDCRLKRKREWAIRGVHEFSLLEPACFLTFTFSQKALQQNCPLICWSDPWNDFSPACDRKADVRRYSIARRHMQKFNKDLRERLAPHQIRFMYCGEYGDICLHCEKSKRFCFCKEYVSSLGRPHYHSIVFGYDFPDKKFYRFIGTKPYYNSDFLSSLWPHGHAVIGDFNFDTAAYVGGYVTAKVSGKGKDFHYKGCVPEFAGYSLKPGIGRFWFDKYWKDIYPRDECVVNIGRSIVKCRPPRAYDKWMKELDPVLFEDVLKRRKERMESNSDDNTYERLKAKHACTVARFKRVVKHLEVESG